MGRWCVVARPAASDKLAVAIEYSLSQVAKAEANAPLSDPAANARNNYAMRAEILRALAPCNGRGLSLIGWKDDGARARVTDALPEVRQKGHPHGKRWPHSYS